MEKIKISLLLHFYQPWWQFPWIITKIVNECYRPILELVDEFDGFCFTANINLSLLVHLEKYYPDIAEDFRKAVENGKLELTGSTAQHPIMPLIPEFIQQAQLTEDREKKENHFGIRQTCHGIFLPEMAFSTSCVELLKSHGYRWTVADDEPFGARFGRNSVPFNSIVSWHDFKVLMRSSRWSNLVSSGKHTFDEIRSMMEYELPGWTRNSPGYLILAMDAETFGHHHHHLINSFLRPMLKEWGPPAQAANKIVSIESLCSGFPETRFEELPDGSWSTSIDDIVRGNPYPLWSSKISVYRYKLWKVVNLALEHFESAREDCLKMTSSCHWWQISRSGWEPEFMQEGAKLAMKVISEFGTEEDRMLVQKDFDILMELKKGIVCRD